VIVPGSFRSAHTPQAVTGKPPAIFAIYRGLEQITGNPQAKNPEISRFGEK
jgi:hypothetical protein